MAEDHKEIEGLVNHSFWFERVHNNGTGQYSIGDAVGTVKSLNVRGWGGGGVFRVINVWDNVAIGLALRIWFFRREPRAVVDNTPFLLHDNDTKRFAAWRDIPAGLYVSNGNIRLAHLSSANVDFSCPDGFLYYIIEARAAGTYPFANRLEVSFGDWPD